MARGWESKSVEAQQSEANEKPTQSRPRLTAEEAALLRFLKSPEAAKVMRAHGLEPAA